MDTATPRETPTPKSAVSVADFMSHERRVPQAVVSRQPHGADPRRADIVGTAVCEKPLLEYADTALPMQTPAHRDFICKRLPPRLAAHFLQT